MIPNGALQAGVQVTLNGIGNVTDGQEFFDNWYWSAGMGFASGAVSGYGLAKEKGLNYWWGNEVKYGRTQWSFFTPEKPYETVSWNIKNAGSLKLNDCVPTSFAEASNYFSGSTTYEEYLTRTGYIEDVGVKANKGLYERSLSKQFSASVLENPLEHLKSIEAVREIQNSGGLIHTNMPDNSIRHADNLRSIQYYHSGKVVMNFRIGSYKLSSVNNNWWFYLLKGVR
jgi:hypothetical protein